MKPTHPKSCIFPVTGKDGQHNDDGFCDYCRARLDQAMEQQLALEASRFLYVLQPGRNQRPSIRFHLPHRVRRIA